MLKCRTFNMGNNITYTIYCLSIGQLQTLCALETWLFHAYNINAVCKGDKVTTTATTTTIIIIIIIIGL